MYGLADIRAMNNGASIRNPQVSTDADLEEAREVYRLMMLHHGGQDTPTAFRRAADLIDAAYGVSED